MKKFITLSGAVVLVISLIAYCNSESTDDQDSSVYSRISDKDVVGTVDKLTKIIEKLNLEQFVGNTILKQHVDTRNNVTVYKLAAVGKNNPSLYERRSNDLKKGAIVLLPSQDKISSRKNKRTYIGLRATKPGADQYFVFYIYLRNPSKNEKGTISVGSEQKVIEYDGWINPEDESSNGYLWKDCSSSIFIPCRTNQVSSFIKPRQISKTKLKSSKSSMFLKSIVTEHGFDADENLDFYLDLIEGGNQQVLGRFSITDLLVGGLKAVGSVAYAVVGRPLVYLATPMITSIATSVIDAVSDTVVDVAGAGISGAAKGAVKSATLEMRKATNNRRAERRRTPEGNPAKKLSFEEVGAGVASAAGSVLKGTVKGALTEGFKALMNGRRRRELENRVQKTKDKEPTTITYTYPGWKTLDSLPESPNDTLSHEADVFVGFGACKYNQVTEASYDEAKTVDDVIYLIASALRTQCMEREIEFYVNLFNEGLLTMNSIKTIYISIDSQLRNTDKLNPKQRIQLSRAFQMSIFSETFKEELYDDKPQIPLTNSANSRHVRMLGQTVLNAIEIIRSSFVHHRIKLLRSLAITVKVVLIKLLEDLGVIEDCETCELDKQVNHSDQLHIMTLLQFIIHGLAPLDKNSQSVMEAFAKFNQTNHLAIQERIERYH